MATLSHSHYKTFITLMIHMALALTLLTTLGQFLTNMPLLERHLWSSLSSSRLAPCE